MAPPKHLALTVLKEHVPHLHLGLVALVLVGHAMWIRETGVKSVLLYLIIHDPKQDVNILQITN